MALSLEWACGFEQFAAISDLNQIAEPWTAQGFFPQFMTISTTTGVRSLQGNGVTPKALNLGSYLSSGVLWTVPNIGTRYLGMGWYISLLPSAEATLLQFTATPPSVLSSAGTDGFRITLDNTGTIRIRQNSTNAVLVTSSAYAVSSNTQYWLSVSCNPNSGWVTFALNGTIIATATIGINFALQYITIAGVGNGNLVIDDLVSYSTDGSDTASTLVPPRSVWTSLPNAVGDQTQWSRVGGAVANWASVDGQAYQTTTYNTTNQTGTLDYYNTTDLPGAPTVIDGVVVTACARKEDSGARDLKLHARVNGVDDVSSPFTLTTGAAFWYLSATFTQAPGSVAWTPSAINLCQLGLESA
ncbi:MAG: hypothetical protein KGI29_05080 [Pseudomonadota bacterium]|nr:hypothetical protein [Pseudomonadota bacterium]MDE3038266.1 hypothetical protein [Pseudomonadota bacterium]